MSEATSGGAHIIDVHVARAESKLRGEKTGELPLVSDNTTAEATCSAIAAINMNTDSCERERSSRDLPFWG